MGDVTVTPLQNFTGYPFGNRQRFVQNAPVKVPAAYAAMLTAKGLIEKTKALTGTASRTSGPEITNLPTRKASADE